ncbi:MAG: carbon storage regulator [Lacipirellulaceae bacterium]
MLVLSRKIREVVVVGGDGPLDRILRVTVLDIQGRRVKLGFEVALDVAVHRLELWEQIRSGERPACAPAAGTVPTVNA